MTTPTTRSSMVVKAYGIILALVLVWIGSSLNRPISDNFATILTSNRISNITSEYSDSLHKRTLFAVVASNHSGADWLLSLLASQEKTTGVCVPTDLDVLDPVPWRDQEERHPCSYAFVRDSIQQITNYSSAGGITTAAAFIRCDPTNDLLKDPLRENLAWLCTWIKQLDKDFSDNAILKLWLHRYQTNNLIQDEACRCQTSISNIRGVKVLADWLPRWPVEPWNPRAINLNETLFAKEKGGSGKVIYLHRRNLLARFRSQILIDHPQFKVKPNNHWNISTEDMLSDFPWQQHYDNAGHFWIQDHMESSMLLMLDYEDCRSDVPRCLDRIHAFLGVSSDGNTYHKVKFVPQSLLRSQAESYGSDSLGLLDDVANREEVKEALLANEYGHFLHYDDSNSQSEQYQPVELLLYERDTTISRSRQFAGVQANLFGPHSTNTKESLFSSALPLLRELPPDRIVVLGDSEREVSVNNLYAPLAAFKQHFFAWTRSHPNAVVFSTSHMCCVNALTHIEFATTSLFDTNVSRGSSSACNSDDTDTCPWLGEDQAQPWKSFQQNIASQRCDGCDLRSPYLDAGLVVGKAVDLVHLLELADVRVEEDATAVLTDLLRHRPDLIMLDYEEKLFGQYRENPVKSSNLERGFSSAIEPLFLQNFKAVGGKGNQLASFVSLQYPVWGDDGVAIQPILDHIQRVVDKTGRLEGIDYTFSPELLYFVDKNGLWTSGVIRNRSSESTLQWRTQKIEENLRHAVHILFQEGAKTRWKALSRALQSGGFPFFAFHGDFKRCNHRNYNELDSIPLFTMSALVGCRYAFPTPSYQQLFDARTDRYRGLFHDYEKRFPFESKIRKVVWRGSLSSNDPDHVYESIRWRLCEKAHNSPLSGMYDIGLTHIPPHNQIVESNLDVVGGLVDPIQPMDNFMKYFAILDMDGNSWSSRFGSLLCYNSVVIKVEPFYVDYYQNDLKAWTHYIPVKNDLSDLDENVAWLLDPVNTIWATDMIAAANLWCATRFNPDQTATDHVDIWESYVRHLDRANPNWSQEWVIKKAELMASPSSDIFQP